MSDNKIFNIYTEFKRPDSDLDGFDSIIASAKSQSLKISLVCIGNEEETLKKVSKTKHDIIGALRTLNMAQTSFENGYKFDDDIASAKIDAIGRAVKALEDNLPQFLDILDTNSPT
jgi:hypothetical protein